MDTYTITVSCDGATITFDRVADDEADALIKGDDYAFEQFLKFQRNQSTTLLAWKTRKIRVVSKEKS